MKLSRLPLLACCVATLTSASYADQFILKDKATGEVYGPFTYQEGTLTLKGGRKMELVKTDVRDETRLLLKDMKIDLVYTRTPTSQILKDLAVTATAMDPQKRTFKINFESVRKNADSPISLSLKQVTIEDAIKGICALSNLSVEVTPDGTVTFKDI